MPIVLGQVQGFWSSDFVFNGLNTHHVVLNNGPNTNVDSLKKNPTPDSTVRGNDHAKLECLADTYLASMR